jgi:hypothetical protein
VDQRAPAFLGLVHAQLEVFDLLFEGGGPVGPAPFLRLCGHVL